MRPAPLSCFGLLSAALLTVVGCGRESSSGPPSSSSVSPEPPAVSSSPAALGRGDPLRGAALLAQYECSRCHEGNDPAVVEGGPAFPVPPRATDDKHCFRCHQAILQGIKKASKPAVTNRWKDNVAHLRDVPTLVQVGKRFRRGWIERFLLEPHDLRPRLEPTMPRLALTPEQARDLAAYYAGEDSDAAVEAPAGSNPANGAKLLNTKGCGSCHVFSGAPPLAGAAPVRPGATGLTPAMTLAPDLRFARDRLRPGALVAWLKSPKAMKPDTVMPETGLNDAEARDMAAYILTAPLAAIEPPRVPERLPVLSRPVSYDEVSQKVFRKTCWHCHSEPDYAIGDGGPGNTGGFGFRPRGLNLAQYDGIASGSLDDQGERRSVFEATSDGPRMLSVLLSRQHEEAGQSSRAVTRGMPLGLPALSPADVQLVETWIAQGRPR